VRKGGRRRDDITWLGETDTKIIVRWNRSHARSFKRYAFRNGKVVRIDPRNGKVIKEDDVI
jgi:hypothetical protein